MLRRPNEENLRKNGKIPGIWRRKNFYLKNFPVFAVLIYPPGLNLQALSSILPLTIVLVNSYFQSSIVTDRFGDPLFCTSIEFNSIFQSNCFISLRLILENFWSFCSNIDSKSLNNTNLNRDQIVTLNQNHRIIPI